jgi:hypothetical protein
LEVLTLVVGNAAADAVILPSVSDIDCIYLPLPPTESTSKFPIALDIASFIAYVVTPPDTVEYNYPELLTLIVLSSTLTLRAPLLKLKGLLTELILAGFATFKLPLLSTPKVESYFNPTTLFSILTGLEAEVIISPPPGLVTLSFPLLSIVRVES